jgi:two-component system NtrC family sensor kinase
MLGYQLNELEPTVSTWESFVHPDDMPIVQHLIKKHLNGDTPFYESEHRCRTKSGEWRWILDRGRVVEREIDGTPIRMAGSHLDIADRKLAEYELIRLNEELEQRVQEEVSKNREKDTFMLQQDKMASIGQLAAGVAHEINNPMGFIISNLGTLKEYTEAMSSYIATADQMILPAAEQAAQLAELRKSLDLTYILNDLESLLSESLEGADRVKQIVHDLKDFARMDETTVTETDLNQCVRSTVNIVRNELKYVAQLDLQLGELPLVTCNPQQINQVITNLLVNAAQAIEGHGTITVTTQQVERQVVLTIADTGSGIPPEVMKRIFEPFFTTKPVGKGTGLGLTISYDMVRKNGGEISVESEPGKGTTFTITLPVSGAVGERHE